MSSLVYFKFKANVKTDSIPFDGSSISVKDLKTGIRAKCRLHSTDFDLKLEDTTGKTYTKDDELIPKYTSIIVCRVPRINNDGHKKRLSAPEEAPWRELQRNVATNADTQYGSKHTNLADSDLPEEEKIKIMMERSSQAYLEKNYAVKAKPYGTPPAAYICHKCNLPGHWIHNCPGVRDKSGKMMDVKTVKRPTGIPQDFLLEVDAGTPGAYLGKSGKYMVPIKDAEAYAQGKKDKRPFSVEENPPYVQQERTPPKQFICPLCEHMFRDAVLVSCCGTTYCNECIMGHVFDAQVLGSHRCPTCDAVLTDHESSVFENALVRSMIRDWLIDEPVIPEADMIPIRSDVFKIEDSEKNFVNNRRVLKPKQASNAVSITQVKTELSSDVPVAKEDEPSENSNANIKDACPPTTLHSPNPKDLTPSPPTSSLDSKLDAEVDVTSAKLAIVPPNTCATVVASAPCTTVVASSRQSLLAATTNHTSIQLPCLSYTSSATMMPSIIPGINTGNNPLLNALCGMHLENLRPHVATQAILPHQFQGSLVGGSDWSTSAALAASVAHGANLVDSVLQASNNQAAFSLVPAQGIPGVLPVALSAPIQAIDGHKVLSKEEFYRLKMEMLHSSRRRHHQRHSRSRSPTRSYRRSSRHPDHRYSRRERSSRERRREHRSPVGYAPDYRSWVEPDHVFEARRERTRFGRRPGYVDSEGSCEQHCRDDRRFVREPHVKLPMDPRYVALKNEHWDMEPRNTSVSPPHRDLRERLQRAREPHVVEQYDDSENSRTLSRSPLTTSVVPQYGLSETESINPEDFTAGKEPMSSRRQLYLRESPNPVNPCQLNTDERNPIADNTEMVYDDRVCPAELTGTIMNKKHKKDKKKKRKHKHHSETIENVSADVEVLGDFEQTTFMDMEVQPTNPSPIDCTQDVTAVHSKKHKKHKKHKREKGKKRKHNPIDAETIGDPLEL